MPTVDAHGTNARVLDGGPVDNVTPALLLSLTGDAVGIRDAHPRKVDRRLVPTGKGIHLDFAIDVFAVIIGPLPVSHEQPVFVDELVMLSGLDDPKRLTHLPYRIGTA